MHTGTIRSKLRHGSRETRTCPPIVSDTCLPHRENSPEMCSCPYACPRHVSTEHEATGVESRVESRVGWARMHLRRARTHRAHTCCENSQRRVPISAGECKSSANHGSLYILPSTPEPVKFLLPSMPSHAARRRRIGGKLEFNRRPETGHSIYQLRAQNWPLPKGGMQSAPPFSLRPNQRSNGHSLLLLLLATTMTTVAMTHFPCKTKPRVPVGGLLAGQRAS